jgi:hypothetical protein
VGPNQLLTATRQALKMILTVAVPLGRFGGHGARREETQQRARCEFRPRYKLDLLNHHDTVCDPHPNKPPFAHQGGLLVVTPPN